MAASGNGGTECLSRDPLDVLGPHLFAHVLHVGACFTSARCVSRAWLACVDSTRTSLSFSPEVPAERIIEHLQRAPKTVRRLSLRGCASLATELDDVVTRALQLLSSLEHIDLAYTSGALGSSVGRTKILNMLEAHSKLCRADLTGCWRLLTPLPKLRAHEVLSLQGATVQTTCSLTSQRAS